MAFLDLGEIEATVGICQQIRCCFIPRDQLEMTGSRAGSIVTITPSTGSGEQEVRPAGPGCIANRLLDHSSPQQAAPRGGVSFVVCFSADGFGPVGGVVKNRQQGAGHLDADGCLGMTAPGEDVGFEGMRDRLVQQDSGGRRPEHAALGPASGPSAPWAARILTTLEAICSTAAVSRVSKSPP